MEPGEPTGSPILPPLAHERSSRAEGNNGTVGANETHARWVEALHRITQETHSLYHYRHLWRRLAEITAATELPPSVIFDAFGVWYASTQASGIRRQVDKRRDSLSLLRLLAEIERKPGVMDRHRHVALWNDEQEGHRNYDRFARDEGDVLDRNLVQTDIANLVAATEPVKRHVDEAVAHTAIETERSTPTYADMHGAVDVIGDLVGKYTSLLEAVSFYTLEPQIQQDWEAPFRVPWIPGA